LEISDKGKPLTAARENFLRNVVMRIIEGWKKIDNERGYLNEITGQNLVVSRKQFGRHYIVLLFPEMRSGDGESRWKETLGLSSLRL
jgi:hypothetical protein